MNVRHLLMLFHCQERALSLTTWGWVKGGPIGEAFAKQTVLFGS